MLVLETMEDVYTIKVKTKPDTRNLYPSERRYSASTVSGLAWVHIALAATSFLLACLALVNRNSDITRLNLNDTQQSPLSNVESILNLTNDTKTFDVYNDLNENSTDFNNTSEGLVSNVTEEETVIRRDCNYVLVVAPSLLTAFALAAGVASIVASSRWYVDRNITWLLIMSILSTFISLTSFIMVATWFATSEGDIRDFYKNQDALNDYLVVKHSDVIAKNGSHIIIKNNIEEKNDDSNLFSKRVISINILIACFLELLWSLLSVKISYKGMRNNYRDEEQRTGNCVSVVTTIKGNDTKRPRNSCPKPLIDSNSRIKRIFLTQNDNGFYLKNQNNKAKQTETSSELYKERMNNFLDRCASLEEGMSECPSNDVEATLNPIKEVTNVEINAPNEEEKELRRSSGKNVTLDRMTPVSWGDTSDHTVYNQNTLNLEKLFTFRGKPKEEKTEDDS